MICTEEEKYIYDRICAICQANSINTERFKLICKSDDYVSAVIESTSGYDDIDLARIKYTNRARWIKFAPEFNKIDLSSTNEINSMTEAIIAAYHFNEPYL